MDIWGVDRKRSGTVTRRLARILAVAALITLFGVTAAAGSPATDDSTGSGTIHVTVSVTVLPHLVSTFTGDGVTVRSNAPWTVSAETTAGERVVIEGEATAGQHVALPGVAGPIEVCAR